MYAKSITNIHKLLYDSHIHCRVFCLIYYKYGNLLIYKAMSIWTFHKNSSPSNGACIQQNILQEHNLFSTPKMLHLVRHPCCYSLPCWWQVCYASKWQRTSSETLQEEIHREQHFHNDVNNNHVVLILLLLSCFCLLHSQLCCDNCISGNFSDCSINQGVIETAIFLLVYVLYVTLSGYCDTWIRLWILWKRFWLWYNVMSLCHSSITLLKHSCWKSILNIIISNRTGSVCAFLLIYNRI